MKTIHSVRPKNFKKEKILAYLFNIIRIVFNGNRFNRLAIEISNQIKIINKKTKKKTRLLDYGCGNMEFSEYLCKKKIVKNSLCVDTYSLKKLYKKKVKYLSIKQFNKKKFSKKYFDVVIIIDTLHHMGVDNAHSFLKKISKVSKFILIKEHFEHGFFSRQLLRFVDFYGNYAEGVNIPKKYFDHSSWNKTIKKARLKQVLIKKSWKQHNGLFNFILHKKHHFISLLK